MELTGWTEGGWTAKRLKDEMRMLIAGVRCGVVLWLQ